MTPSAKSSERRRGAAVWVATAGGAGSLVGVAIVAGLHQLPLPPAALVAILGAASGALFALGVWAAGEAEKFFGRTDPGQVVVDEVVGQMLTFLLLPRLTLGWLLLGFLLFRVFDIFKPFPARQAERFSRGWGIMLDDVIAGVYGLCVLTVLELIRR